VRAVDGLSFDVTQGEVFALLGPNGAGKTTVVRMLVGILRPDSGEIVFSTDGQLLSRPDPHDFGYLPEERGLYRDAAVLKTLEYFAVLRGMERADARAAAQQGLEMLELGDRGSERVDALSKGNQQKVQFLSAILHRPRFAVLDEPFTGLDPVNQQRFMDEIRRLRDEGCTVLLSAHQMDLVESLADRLLLMDRGRAVLHGTLEEIRRQTESGDRLQLGVSPNSDSDALSDVAGVSRVERSARDRIELLLERDAHVGEVLHSVTERCEVRSVHSGVESLREIFVRTVGHPIEEEETGS
jgi:ABC-2 type transport system ATP-binding protein